MPRQQRFIQLPLIGKVFLCVLASVYIVYLAAMVHYWTGSSSDAVVEHVVNTGSSTVLQHWTLSSMRAAADADTLLDTASSINLTQGNVEQNLGKATKQQGKSPLEKSVDYPLSTVGKVFFTNASGQDMVCSGTAVTSANRSVVDTAGHCLYWSGNWVENMVFCPLYENGNTPFGCWAARDLEVPADWIHARPNDYHHDMGIAIVAPNSKGLLTDIVGGAGWAYNQRTDLAFYAYGYPAGYPYDGQTRQSCEDGDKGRKWQHGDGTVVSIPCGMTGGSSGGPWFIHIKGHWYLNGHNDFSSSVQPGHMFSPYYDSTWYTMYDKAQKA